MKTRIKSEINLTYDTLIALLQGKEIHLVHYINDNECEEYIFIPPFDGVFMTHDSIHRIKFNAQIELLDFIDKLSEYREDINIEKVEDMDEEV